ncbi:MAG: hypothetical protein D6788_10095, partial [Planctomycetota bacterium]
DETPPVELGRGRSGVVFREQDASGALIARKVFGSSGLTKLVQYVFLGAPNPYLWNEHAVRSAYLRRRILAELLEARFGDKLRVARAKAYRWNNRQRAYELSCAFVAGRHVPLHHPFRNPEDHTLRDLRKSVLRPLQRFLVETGFDGLVWQAGRGNPVALNNFLCENPDEPDGHRWVWIDLESGVPALIPLNPIDLFAFYLPRSIRFRRPLFDDVNVAKLRNYLRQHAVALTERLGPARMRALLDDVEALDHAQQVWKSLPRYRRSIAYRLRRGDLTEAQAAWYAERPFRWYAREALRATASLPNRFDEIARRCVRAVTGLDWKGLVRSCGQALRSQAYRTRLARRYLKRRIDDWRRRGQLEEPRARDLYAAMEGEQAGSYLADFGVHLAVKPLVKAVQFGLIPALWVGGILNGAIFAFLMVWIGSIVRTLYTLGRMAQEARRRHPLPWWALGVGTLPVLGNLAFPVQILRNGSDRRCVLARFLVYDTFTRLGRCVPVWGGPDTLTEHAFNRLAGVLLRLMQKAVSEPCAACEHDDAIPTPAFTKVPGR